MGDAVERGVARVEAVVRILEDDLDVLAEFAGVKVARRDLTDRLAVEQDRPLARVDQPADHARGRALARAALSDETDTLTPAHRHRKIGDADGAVVEALGNRLD